MVRVRWASLHPFFSTDGRWLGYVQGGKLKKMAIGGGAHYAVAADGTLVYVSGELVKMRELVWVERDGAETPATAERRVYRHPQLSPRSDRIAVSIEDPTDPARQDIWLLEPGQGTFRRLTFSGENFYPRGSPDGSEIFYRNGSAMVVVQITREPEFRVLDRELLLAGNYFAYRYHQQYDVSADGQRFLLIKQPDDLDEAQSSTVVINWLDELRRTLDTTNDWR